MMLELGEELAEVRKNLQKTEKHAQTQKQTQKKKIWHQLSNTVEQKGKCADA